MSAAEYRAIIDRLGLTQVGAARLLGIDGRTSRRWALGERDIPAPVGRFLRFLVAAEITPDEVETALRRADDERKTPSEA